MPSHYEQAGQAIGEVVADLYPTDAINWGNLVPSGKWGMKLALWREMLRRIRERFEAHIDPCRIRSGEDFAGSLDKQLYILQRRLNDSVVCPGEEGFDD
jgi:hypothetical protein